MQELSVHLKFCRRVSLHMLSEVTIPHGENPPSTRRGRFLRLSKFAMPWLPSHFNKKTGLVHGLVYRPHRNRIVFYLEEDHDNDRRPMFVAQRRSQNSDFNIFDVSHERGCSTSFLLNESEFISLYDKRFLGVFRQIELDSPKRVGYSLYMSNSLVCGKENPMIHVASFLYALTSLGAMACRFGLPECHPRQTHVAIYSEDKDTSGGRGIDLFEQSMSSVQCGKLRIQDITKDQYIARMAASDVGVNVFESRLSAGSPSTQNRRCRVRSSRVPSKKNIQIVSASNTEDVVLLMAKRNDKEYYVDFDEPFNAFQALGFALAQLEF